MDEKGFLLRILQKTKRVFTEASLRNGKLLSVGQDGSREWIIILTTIYIDGTYLSPSLIY